MTEQTALARREQFKPVTVPSDDEIRRQWRLAEALSQAQLFDGAEQKVNTAEAFAKILVGHDLGLSATQALMGVHIVKGKPQLSANLLASFVKRTPGYDYEVTTHTYDGSKRPPEGECTIVFKIDGEPVGLPVTFTMEDARRQKLVKDGSAWTTVPKNMLFARALSNGVKWYMPDATGGIAVYVPGELQAADTPELTAGTGTGEAQGLDLGPKVEKVLARAAELGHEAIADRATAEIALGRRSPEVAVKWVDEKTAELDAFEAEQAKITDAEVVEDKAPVDAGTDAERAAAARQIAEQLDRDAEGAITDGEEDKAAELRAGAAQMREQAEALEAGDDGAE